MSLYRTELKRLLKTRSVQLLLLFSVLLTLFFSYLPISFVEYGYQENGKEVLVKGMKAVSMRRDAWESHGGVVTEEKIAAALTQYQKSLAEYGEDGIFFDLPDSEYCEKIAPISPLVYRLREVSADSKTGLAPSLQELTEGDALNFYQKCDQRLDDVLRMEQSDHPAAISQAKALYSHVEMPFSYYPGLNLDSADYLVFLILVLTIVAVLIAAPVFSSEYQTGSDHILQCAKYGRKPLAAAKIKVTLTLTSALYLFCVGLYLLIEGTAFGWDTLKTSIQAAYSATSFPALNIGQLELLTAGAGLLAYIATVLFVLFLSSKLNAVYTTVSLSLLFCILPSFSSSFLPDIVDLWARCLMPSGGIGMNSFMFELLDTRFLHLGSLSLWYPFALILGSVLEIPLWLFATLHAYQKHIL